MATDIPHLSRIQVKVRDLYTCSRCRTPTQNGQWHHRRSRSVRDDHQHCACNGIWLCATCHRWVHANPFEARQHGWIVSRHQSDPSSEPVLTAQFGWVFLDHTGGYEYVPEDLIEARIENT